MVPADRDDDDDDTCETVPVSVTDLVELSAWYPRTTDGYIAVRSVENGVDLVFPVPVVCTGVLLVH